MGHRRGKKRSRDFNRGQGPRNGAIQIWCDGSAYPNPGPSSAGALVICDGAEYPAMLHLGDGTNNTAELKAIALGLSLIEPGDRDREIDVFTDSQYAIAVLTGRRQAHKNVDLIQGIRSAMTAFTRLRFIWVPGHADSGRNPDVDRLAAAARENHIRLLALGSD